MFFYFTGSSQGILQSTLRYGKPFIDEYSSSLVSSNSLLYSSHSIFEVDSSGVNTGINSSSILCSDYSGDLVWEKIFKDEIFYASRLFTNAQKQLFYIEFYHKEDSIVLIEINDKGQKINNITLRDNENRLIRNKSNNLVRCSVNQNQEILLGFETELVSNFFSENHGKKDVWLMKFDKNGELVWKKNMGGSSNDYLMSITPCNKTLGFYTVINTFSNDDVFLNNGELFNIWVTKYDENANIIWHKRVGNNENKMVWHEHITTSEDDDIYLLHTSGYEDAGNANYPNYNKYFIKVNAEGNTIHQRVFKNFDLVNVGQLFFYNKQLYFCMSTNWFKLPVSFDNNVLATEANNILTMDETLKVVYSIPIKIKAENVLGSYYPDAIVVDKNLISFALQNSVYYNQNDSRYSHIDTWIGTIRDVSNFSKECVTNFEVFPNPITNDETKIYVKLKENYNKSLQTRFCNIAGQLISSNQIEVLGNQFEYPLPQNLSSGIYFISFVCENEIITKKVVVQ